MRTLNILQALTESSDAGPGSRAKSDRRVLRALERLFGPGALEAYPASEVWRFPSEALRRMRSDGSLSQETTAAYDGFLLQLWERAAQSGRISVESVENRGARLQVPRPTADSARHRAAWRAATYVAESLAYAGIRADSLPDGRLPANMSDLIGDRFPAKDADAVLLRARSHFSRTADPEAGPVALFPKTLHSARHSYGVSESDLPAAWRDDLSVALLLATGAVPQPGRSLERRLSTARAGTWRETVCRLVGYAANVRGISLSRWRSLADLLADTALIDAWVAWDIRTRANGVTKRRHKGMWQIPADLLRLMGHPERGVAHRRRHGETVVSEDDTPDPRRDAPELDPEEIARQTRREWDEIMAEWRALKPSVARRRTPRSVRVRFERFVNRVLGALLVDVLLREPMRSANLTGLRLGSTDVLGSIWRDEFSHIWHLFVASSDVKNREAIRRELPPVVCEHLDFYHDEIRPRLGGARRSSALWLTPRGEEFKVHTTLSLIRAHTERVFGCRLRTKDFRPLGAVFYWLFHPADIETVRRLLRHRTSEVTTRSYLVVAQHIHSRFAHRFLRETAGKALEEMETRSRRLRGLAL